MVNSGMSCRAKESQETNLFGSSSHSEFPLMRNRVGDLYRGTTGSVARGWLKMKRKPRRSGTIGVLHVSKDPFLYSATLGNS